jgi:DNA-binding NarL/FixJ family response regulator
VVARAHLGDEPFGVAWNAGRAACMDEIADYALGKLATPHQDKPADLLTGREREVARQIATGLTNRQIAEHLVVSERTVDAHCRHIFDNLGVSSRSKVAAWAVVSGQGAR